VFELAIVVHKEYSGNKSEGYAIAGLSRTIPRFIGTVCVALSLEGLIMVIKYSQLDLAGNLYQYCCSFDGFSAIYTRYYSRCNKVF
tara:strand:+ start:2952 stop:3209 length:258 start_codon:yes stop_codon:yes gene_type:complete